MENPEPLREHHELDQLAGHFAGPERMHPSPWNPTAVKAEAVTDARIALDGFAVVQDYEQRLEDGSRFAGHGVFRYDAPSDTYEMHWFDSTGSAPRIFRGGFADRMLVLIARAGDGWQRLTYDFNLAGGYRFKLETSDDGNDWKLALEGDNFEDRVSQAQVAASEKRKMTGRKAAASNSSASKATAKKTPARKAAAKKATAKKAPAKKTTAKKATAKKATAKKATAKTGTRKVSARAGAKKTAKTAPASRPAKKTATGTAKKRAAAGTTAKKTAKKAAAKTSGVRKAAARKTAAGKARAKKAGSRTTVAAIERKRRQGTASKKIAAKKTSARGNGRAAGAPVSQKNVKGGAKRAPQMLTVRKTSTRTGGHRTAAKGARMR